MHPHDPNFDEDSDYSFTEERRDQKQEDSWENKEFYRNCPED